MTEKKKTNEFVCGFATALIEVYDLHGADGIICRTIIDSFGYTLEHFKDAGLDKHDLATLKRIMTL